MPYIDRIITPDALEVHNVLEVPTDQDMADRGNGDMLRINQLSGAQHTFAQVKLRQFFCFRRQADVFPMLFRNPVQYIADFPRRLG